MTKIDLNGNGMVQSLQLIESQLRENKLLQINLKLPEIQREVKMLRVQNSVQKDVLKEYNSNKLLQKKVESELI